LGGLFKGLLVTDEYDPKQVLIERLPLKGVRVDRVHGREYIVNPRYYRVNDANLRTRGDWTVELHKKLVERTSGDLQEVTIVKALMAPMRASVRMASLTRQSIMIVPGTLGSYKGRPYAHVSFRPAQTAGGRRTAARGEKGHLPEWFSRLYKRRLRLRATVQGKIASSSVVGRRLSKFHDIKQVITFADWNDEEFIRFFFVVRIYAADLGFSFGSQAED
jgi:hypothetical protein